jgi:hypothetical protein
LKLKFFNSNELEKPFKLSVHKSGKLGFTLEAAKAMELTKNKSISIGMNEDDLTDQRLYMIVNEKEEPGAFKVAKAGVYYYLPIKLLLDNLKIPYHSENVVFNMEKVNFEGQLFYRLTRIDQDRKAIKEETQETQAL